MLKYSYWTPDKIIIKETDEWTLTVNRVAMREKQCVFTQEQHTAVDTPQEYIITAAQTLKQEL